MDGPQGQEYHGYSGAPGYVNDPSKEEIANRGPIPRGRWRIDLHPDGSHGPFTLHLSPVGHNAHGRNRFRIHGENHQHPGASSTGCIILSLAARQAIVQSGDNNLLVVRD